MSAPAPTVRLGLVGSGPALAKAIASLKGAPRVEIAVIADATGTSEGSRLGRSLGIPIVANAMEVFRGGADLILEVNGDERLYERLLAVKPPRVEVMSARGARLLIDLLAAEYGGNQSTGAPHVKALVIVDPDQASLYDYLQQGFAGIPGIEVIADRRKGERRQRIRAQATERRASDRRLQPDLEAGLRSRGFVITRAEARRSGR